MPDIFISSGNQAPLAEDKKPKEQIAEEKSEEATFPSPTDGTPIGIMTSFAPRPLNITYDDVDPDEVILLFLRRHFITNVPWIVQGIGLIFLPFLIAGLLSFANITLDFVPPNLMLFSILFYYFLVLQFFFLHFLNWFYNISLVTNKKVIDIDFRVLLSKNVAATKISQVEDVTLNEVGLIRSVFDYGDIFVQTAGTIDNFEFLAVPHPERVVHIIGDLIGEGNHA